MPSARPVGNATIDTIHIQWWRSSSTTLEAGGHKPAIVIVPGLGDTYNSPQDYRAAQYFMHRGIDCAIILLPYSGERLIDGKKAQNYYLSADASVTAQAFIQGASDVSTVMDWVKSQPGVDVGRTGIVGWSLGAVIVHLAMGLDSQFGVGVAIGGGGNLHDIDSRGLISFSQDFFHPVHPTPAQQAILRTADPLTYAANNQPRHVLMIEGARDTIIPPNDASVLWHALGEPPIQWADFGHFGIGFAEREELDAAYAYLINNWAPSDAPDPPVPQVSGPEIKVGFLTVPNSNTLLALQYQAVAIGHKSDHTSLFSLNVGQTTSRPFAAFGYTASHFVDIGVAMRLGDNGPEGYIATYFPL